MSSVSDGSPSVDEPGGDGRSSSSARAHAKGSLKYLLLFLILSSWVASALLSFATPVLADRLVLWGYLPCLIVLFFVSLASLFRLRWKDLAILVAIWAIALWPYYNFGPSLLPLRVVAFRLHAYPVEEYLSRCKLNEFVENGVKQAVGVCEAFGVSNEEVEMVIYDTTGEFVLPVSQRTPEWTQAMMRFYPDKLLARSEDRGQLLFENFYDFSYSIYEAGNNSGER